MDPPAGGAFSSGDALAASEAAMLLHAIVSGGADIDLELLFAPGHTPAELLGQCRLLAEQIAIGGWPPGAGPEPADAPS